MYGTLSLHYGNSIFHLGVDECDTRSSLAATTTV